MNLFQGILSPIFHVCPTATKQQLTSVFSPGLRWVGPFVVLLRGFELRPFQLKPNFEPSPKLSN